MKRCAIVSANYRQPFVEAPVYRAWPDIKQASPLSHSPCLAVVSRRARCVAPVVTLFSWQRPAAVMRRVMAVVVDAIQLVLLGWLPAHVGKEAREIDAPLIAHSNPAPTPIGVAAVRRVETAAAHIAPGFIFRAAAGSRLVPVDGVTRTSSLSDQAAAATGYAAAHVVPGNRFDAPAVAATYPERSSRVLWGAMQDKEPAETLARKVDHSHDC
jgi:hypothetical protein